MPLRVVVVDQNTSVRFKRLCFQMPLQSMMLARHRLKERPRKLVFSVAPERGGAGPQPELVDLQKLESLNTPADVGVGVTQLEAAD